MTNESGGAAVAAHATPESGSRNQFGTMIIRQTVAYVEHRRREGTVELTPARERARQELSALWTGLRDKAWLSYDEFRRALELAAAALGGPDELDNVLSWSFVTGQAGGMLEPMRALGSVAALFAVLPGMTKNALPALTGGVTEIGPQELIVTTQTPPEFPMYPELHHVIASYCAAHPVVFGGEPASVTEEQGSGPAEFEYRLRVRWDEPHGTEHDRILGEMRVGALEATLSDFQDLVADVVSGKSAGEVLHRIVSAASRSSIASCCALILKPRVLGERRVIEAEGYEPEAAERLADELLGDGISRDADPSRIVVDVASEERHHGYLVTVDESRSLSARDPRLVQTYARLAAAYLDSVIANEMIRHNAFHDALTGLANRALILDRLEQMLLRSSRNRTPCAVLFLDLDGFKQINDTLGHETGDHLLQAVSTRLQATVRQADTIGRLGGDEFVVLLDGATIDVGPELVAERIRTILAQPYELPNTPPTTLTSSIGIAIANQQTPSELLRDADIALYRAKQEGRNKAVMFAPEMQTTLRDRHLLEMDLRTALAEQQFFLVYQPIINLANNTTTAIEALLRWQHPTRGVIEPDEFIPILEETGLIKEVGNWVLQQACHQAAELTTNGHPLTMTVNIAVAQLETPNFPETIQTALTNSGLPPNQLILEITETALMRDIDTILPHLTTLRNQGIRIAIDDFGTGYSSLAYLQQFPIDTIKIDRSFIAAMTETPEAATLVHTLVQLGKTLKLETLAEGIEHPTQHTTLQQQHCDSGQGYLFTKPLTTTQLHHYLTNQQTPDDRYSTPTGTSTREASATGSHTDTDSCA